MKYEIQFRGYQPRAISLPLQSDDDNPFENVDLFTANEILANTVNGGDEAEDGWISGDAAGEDFQIRDSFHS